MKIGFSFTAVVTCLTRAACISAVLALQACAPLETTSSTSEEATGKDLLGPLLANCPISVKVPERRWGDAWGDLSNAKVVSGSVNTVYSPSNRTYLAVIKQSTGAPQLDLAMIESIRQWTCDKPSQLGKSVTLDIPFHFSIDGSPLPLPHFRPKFAGIHTVESFERIRDPNSLTGRRQISKGYQPQERTNTIPGKLGTRMGLVFTMDSAYATTSYPYKRVLKFPSPGLTNPVTGKHADTDQHMSYCRPGQDCVVGYSFDEPWEIVPGDWTFEVWVGDKLLHSETFKVVTP